MCEPDIIVQPEEEEEECVCTPKEKKPKKELEGLPPTCPYDPRFPNVNQTRRCMVNFIDYHKCTRLLGNYQGCRIFKLCYESLCPQGWLDKWFEQMENGTFPYALPNKVEGMEEPDDSEPFDTTGY